MSSTDLPHINHKRDAIYYKFSWSDDEASISENEFQLSLKRYVNKILNETQLDNRPISCQHLSGLDVSSDLLSGLVYGSDDDLRLQAIKPFSRSAPDVFKTGSEVDEEIPERWEFPPDRLDSGYVELHVSTSCNSVDGSRFMRQSSTLTGGCIEPLNSTGCAVNIESLQEEFYFDDELETLPVLSPIIISSGPFLSCTKTTTAVQTEESLLEGGTLLERNDKEKSEYSSKDRLNPLPHTEDTMATIQYRCVSQEWRAQCLKIVVSILTLMAGLGTISSIAYLLIKFLFLA